MNESAPTPPVRGLVAGKYEVLNLIGRGGMGTVWEGRHTSLGTRVAIKFVDQEYADSQEARARFVTEARAAATIQSKHAIQIYDHGVTDDGRPYIVMELLVGEPLDKRIERVGRLPLGDTARVLGQVCRALQRAHDAGIIHRDLKPENVFLVRTPDDDEEIAKVLDFGIAKFRGPSGGSGLTSSTKTGAVLGTPYYMSPEQARGLRNIDQRTDLWSIGVIAYKCVTGVLPFDGESVGDLLVKICTAPAPQPSLLVPGLPPTFDGWFARALERDPERRFRTATEMADALSMLAGLSQRRSASQDFGMGPYAHPNRTGGGGRTPAPPSAVSAAGAAPGAVTSAPFTASARQAKSSRGMLVGVAAAAVVGASVGAIAVVKLVASPKHPNDAAAVVTSGLTESSRAVLPATSAGLAPPSTGASMATPPSPAPTVAPSPAIPSPPTPSTSPMPTSAHPTARPVSAPPSRAPSPSPPAASSAAAKLTPQSASPAPSSVSPAVPAKPAADPGY